MLLDLPPAPAELEESAFLDAERALILSPWGFLPWFEGYGKIKTKAGKLESPVANPFQARCADTIAYCIERDLPIRLIKLKGRQQGCSTVSSGELYWLIRRAVCDGLQSVIIGGEYSQGDNLWEMVKRYHDNDVFPWPSPEGNINTRQGTWPNGASLSRETARDSEAGRAYTFQAMLACVPGETQVICADGVIKRIDAIEPGEMILTHNGNLAPVCAVTGFPNSKGDLYRIHTAIGQPESFTFDHPIFTQRGKIQASEIVPGDWVTMPIRKITHDRQGFTIPDVATRWQGGGRARPFAGTHVEFTEAFGYFVGYFLSNGTIGYSEKKYPHTIGLASDKDDEWWKEALEGVKPFSTSVYYRQQKSRTFSVEIRAAGIAQWLAENFGSSKNGGKRIPDWVFDCGKPFCLGLVRGFFAGDGSKKMAVSKKRKYGYVDAKAVYSSLLTQIRDMAVSLGFGWAGITFMAGGIHYGRNCRDRWQAKWCGQGGRKIRESIGLENPPIMRNAKHNRWKIEDGKVWIQVKKVDRVPCEKVWDLSVAHDDHSFRLKNFACGNTEAARWKEEGVANATAIITGILNCIPDLPGTYACLESTAAGDFGMFYEYWLDAIWVEDHAAGRIPANWNGFFRVFSPWFEHDEASMVLSEREAARVLSSYTASEAAYAEEFNLTPNQMAWYRRTMRTKCKRDPAIMKREYPATPEEAFNSASKRRFSQAGLAILEAEARQAKPTPGVLEPTSDRPETARYNFRPIHEDAEGAVMLLYEAPRAGLSYVMAIDTATGASQTDGDDPDCHCAVVIRNGYVHPTKGWQRAAVVAITPEDCRWDIDIFAHWCFAMHDYYGRCITIPEANNDRGLIVLLKNMGANLYERHKDDEMPAGAKSPKPTGKYGIQTTGGQGENTRNWMIESLAREIREWDTEGAGLYVPDLATVKELKAFVIKKSGRAEAAEGRHDDRVMALAIGNAYKAAATTMLARVGTPELPPDIAAGNRQYGERGAGGQWS